MGEGLAEIPGGDAGHAHGRQSLDFVKAQLQKLGVSDGIDVRVVGARAVPGHQERLAFVQIVHDGGMPIVKHAVHGLGGLVRLLVSVAIDIDEGVLRPVGRRLPGQSGAVGLAFEIAVEPLHHLVASVGIGDGVNENDEVLADALDHGLFGNCQAVGHFQHGFGGTGLVGMQGGVEVIDWPGILDQAFGGSRIGAARIGEGSSRAFQAIKFADASLVRDCEQQNLASFFAVADGENAHPRRSGGKSAAIGIGFGGVHEFARRAGDPA